MIIKRNIIYKIFTLENKLAEISGHLAPNQYDERKLHFSEEKYRLIEILLMEVLPNIVKESVEKLTENSNLAFVVDSGTTLEQFFPRIKLSGLGPNISDSELQKIEIYTNSLSGSDSFCKTQANYLHENQLHLFGGTQIEKYRAVTGSVTISAMKEINTIYHENKSIIIGIITANWFLVGSSESPRV